MPFEKFKGNAGTPVFDKYWAGTIHLHVATEQLMDDFVNQTGYTAQGALWPSLKGLTGAALGRSYVVPGLTGVGGGGPCWVISLLAPDVRQLAP